MLYYYSLHNLPGAQQVEDGNVLTSGPIFLEGLYCTENDVSLQNCRMEILGIGLTSCSHDEDVWVKCYGEFEPEKKRHLTQSFI